MDPRTDPAPSSDERNRVARGSDESITPVAPANAPCATGILALDAPPTARDIRDSTVIKDGDLFLLTDLEGNAPRGSLNGYGLYLGDTRHLSAFELAVQHMRPIILLAGGKSHFLGAHVLTNPALVTVDGRTVYEQSIQIRRYRVVRPMEIHESLSIQNYNRFPLTLSIALHFEADFADIFEVRGLVPLDTGTRVDADFEGGILSFRRTGRDGITRLTSIALDPPPSKVTEGTASYEIPLPAGGSQRIGITLRVDDSRSLRPAPADAATKALAHGAWLDEMPTVETSSGLFDAILAQSRLDLRALLNTEQGIPYVAAGIPWYACLFGRDSLITALQHLWMSPALARATLELLARYQGTRDDPTRDEEPGKIMHELRRGELAHCGLVPFTPYYGTIDATPLWVILLGEYYRVTGDIAFVQSMRSHLEAALEWIDRYADPDGDGFVEYHRRTSSGLVNQGWKDSWDGIVHADGAPATGPIALVEVQAYVFRARRLAAALYRTMGEPERASRLVAQAEALRDAFEGAFWSNAIDCYALGLDGEKRPMSVMSSNAGHALWCGIAAPERAERVGMRMVAEDMFTGWGIRTLSNREVAYNPAGYHLGTLWPHDNALIALGMKRYHQEAQLLEVVTGLYDAAQHFPQFRMPELFCGFARSAFGVPVRYPVACSPQAWAAASWSALLQAMLGIRQDGPAGELHIVRPMLPRWLDRVRVSGIRVGDGSADLRYERIGDHTAVDVVQLNGGVRVVFSDRWSDDG